MSLSNRQRAAAKHRNIGLAARPPREVCRDAKCPWHGRLPVRGRIFEGRVVAARANRTAMVEWGFVHYLPKFQRYERRHSHVAAHNPACIAARAGDAVRIAECRPLSKTKGFVVVEKLEPLADSRTAIAAIPHPERRTPRQPMGEALGP